MESNTIRSFVAIELPDIVRGQLESLARDLKKSDAQVGWVRPDGIHLTLKFLGNVAPELIEEMKPVIAEITARAETFQLRPASCGAFPNVKQPRVVWVGLRGESEQLIRIQKEVDLALVPFGFKPEDRPFRPHLTLGRVRGRQRIQVLQQALLDRREFATEPFDVTELVLYKSDLRPDGARYTPLFRAPFGHPA